MTKHEREIVYAEGKAQVFGLMAVLRLREEPLDIPTAEGAYLFARKAAKWAAISLELRAKGDSQ